jgi:hypothetical protein
VIALLVTFALFALTVWTGGRRGVRPRHAPGRAGTMVLSLAAGFPLAAVASSSFWDLPSSWVTITIFLAAGALAASAGGGAMGEEAARPDEGAPESGR